MNLARYWAKTQVHATPPDGGTMHFSLWRGSDASQADAETRAMDAAEQWRQRITLGNDGPDEYDYAMGTRPEPIVDEYLAGSGERLGAVTINRAGCRVLNTARLAFIDIDKPEPARQGVLKRLFGAKKQQPPADDFVTSQTERVRSWVRREPGVGVRVYETANGLRLLVTNPPMDPEADRTHQLMAQLGADDRYAALCRVQACFRARLTPKPWRTDAGAPPLHLTMDRLQAPDSATRSWEERYAKVCERHSVCRLVEVVGRETPDDDSAALTKQHDDEAGVGTGLPLA